MSGNNPELSVILPVYNVAPWLFECLDSVAAQTFTNFEAILVDDGSTDFSGLFCDSYARKDSRFRVIHQSNQGVSAARNVGIEAARAPLLAFIDPDDFISPNFFDGLITALRRENADVAEGSRVIIGGHGKESLFYAAVNVLDGNAPFWKKGVFKGKEIFDGTLNELFFDAPWGRVYKRELFDNNLFPVNVDLSEDVPVIKTALSRAKVLALEIEAKYFWRQRMGSLTHVRLTKERYTNQLTVIEETVRRLKRDNPEYSTDIDKWARLQRLFMYQGYHMYYPERSKDSILYIMCEAARETEGGIP